MALLEDEGASSSERGSMLTRLRRLALRLSHSPLHPQWFTFMAKRRAHSAVAREARGTVVDIGCGDCSLRSGLRPTDRYVGVDYPSTAKTLYRSLPDLFADAARLPFTDRMVDAVVMLDVIEHLREPESAMAEAARVLDEGGQFYAHIPYMYPLHDAPHDYSRFTEFGIVYRMQHAGLVVERVEPAGSPSETVALLFNVALAKMMWRTIHRFPPALVLIPVACTLFLLANICGWCVGRVYSDPGFMPLTYFVVARRVADAGEPRPS